MNKKTLRELPLHMMLFPSVLILVIFSYIPMLGVVMAFQKYLPTLGFFKSKWVGFSNFAYVFSNPDFYRAFKNTLYIAVLKIILGILVPVIFSLLLNEAGKLYFKRGIQTIIYLPHFLSWVILAGITIDILSPSNGAVNILIKAFGFEPIFFLGDNKWFPITIVATHIWKEFGWGTIVYLAALTSIDPSIYEAAIVDGANRWKQTLHITIPGIVTTVILITTLQLGHILNAGFDQIFNLYSPMVYESGDILDTLVYRIGIEGAQFSIATATGLFKSVISTILIVTSYKLAYKMAGYKIF